MTYQNEKDPVCLCCWKMIQYTRRMAVLNLPHSNTGGAITVPCIMCERSVLNP